MVAKMTKAFEVTVDFLIGDGKNVAFDKGIVQRINDILKMDPYTKILKLNRLCCLSINLQYINLCCFGKLIIIMNI